MNVFRRLLPTSLGGLTGLACALCCAVPAKFQGRALTLDARRAAAAAVVGASIVVPAHYDGWAHFSEGLDDVERAFDDAGLSSLLKVAPHGTWVGSR